MNQVARVSTDATGLIVTLISGAQFMPSWAGLQIVINNDVLHPATIASVGNSTHLTLAAPVTPNLSGVPLGPNRETIYQAFFNLVKQAPGIVTATRTPITFSNVPPEQQPLLYVEQMGESPLQGGRGIPYNWQFDVAVGVLVYSANPNTVVPASLLNPILDALEFMLPPSPTSGAQTLDGLVNEARLIGNGREAAGAVTTQAWAYVPARISVV